MSNPYFKNLQFEESEAVFHSLKQSNPNLICDKMQNICGTFGVNLNVGINIIACILFRFGPQVTC